MNRNWKMWIVENDDLPDSVNSMNCDEVIGFCEQNLQNDDMKVPASTYEITVPEWVPESEVEKFAEKYLYAEAFRDGWHGSYRDGWDGSYTAYFVVEN